MMGAQFRDEICGACGHEWFSHAQQAEEIINYGGVRLGPPLPVAGRCSECKPERRCQRFVERAERKEEEAEG